MANRHHPPILQPYAEQSARWPSEGRHILADYDDTSVVVYQAYNPAICSYALAHQALGGSSFSFSRMSWIKPNFLWMMYRSSWGTAPGQEGVLGIRISRSFFDTILASAVASSHDKELFADVADWRSALATSDVRLQWDPDHDPSGTPVSRRAVQLGLRGDVLRAFATEEILEITDMSGVVEAGRPLARSRSWSALMTPAERVYPTS